MCIAQKKISEGGELFYQAVEELLMRTPAHPEKLKRPYFRQLRFQRILIDLDFFRLFAINKGIRGSSFFRQPDVPQAIQSEHQPPADHIAQRAVGLNPVPCLAKLFGQPPSAVAGILRDQFIDKNDIFTGNDSAAISKHEHQISQHYLT